MSTVLPSTEEEEEVVTPEYVQAVSKRLLSNQEGAETPLTFGDRFNHKELTVLSTMLLDTPVHKKFVADVLAGKAGEKSQKDFQVILDKFKLYNRAPIEEEPNPYQLPEFIQNKIPFIPKQRQIQRRLNALGFSGRDQYKDPYASGAALDVYQTVFNPAAALAAQFSDTDKDITKSPRFARLFYDRHLDPIELKRILVHASGHDPDDVKVHWIDPNHKALGMVMRTPDIDGYEVWDQGYITGFDFLETIGTDAPAWIAEGLARAWALRKGFGKKTFDTGTTKSILGRIKEVGATGLTFGVGGATGEFARLTTGNIFGINDYNFKDIAIRSGLTGVVATGSVVAGDLAARILSKIWSLRKGLVPDAAFKDLKEAFEQAFNTGRRKNNQPPGVLVQNPQSGEWVMEEVSQETLDNAKLIDAERLREEITTKDIQDAVSKLLPDVNYTIEGADKILNLGAALPKNQLINDLEHVFLKNAKDAKIRKVYDAMIKGQGDVLNRFIYALNEATGATIDKNVSAADLAKELNELGTNRADVIKQGQHESLTNVLNILGGMEDDTGAIGTELATLVPDPDAGQGFMPRKQLRAKELKEAFLQPAFDDWNNALNNDKYADLTTNARFLKTPAKAWKNIAKQYKEFQTADAADAKNSLYTILGADSANKLRRLQGLGKVKVGGFINPDYTMEELNDMRVVLNKFASESNNTSAIDASRQLERGLESQMHYLVNSKASELSGIPLGGKGENFWKNATELAQWKKDNNFGIDLEKSWDTLSKDIVTSKVISDTQALQSNPENFINNLVENTPAFSKTYSNADKLVYILEKTGSPLLDQLRRSTSAYIQQNVLGQEFETPILKAREFNKWVKQHEGLMKAIYPEKIFGKVGDPKRFRKNILQKLEASDQKIFEIEQTFGNKPFTNIVTSYLDKDASFKRGGDYKEAQTKFLTMIKESKDPILQDKLSSIAKGWLLNTVMERDAENIPVLSPDKLNDLFIEGFGSTETGETFEKFFAPLIGGAEGKQYVYNLKILNNIAQRQRGMESSAQALENKELTTPQTGWLERFFIPPLTQTGRRITNFRNITADSSSRVMANLLLDHKLFDKVMKSRKRQLNFQEFLRFMSASGAVSWVETNNKLGAYRDPKDELTFEHTKLAAAETLAPVFNYIVDEIIPETEETN